jgi:ABC-type branched-subunit amino acid transport system permease subunit
MTWAISMPIVSGIVLVLIAIVAIVLTLPRVLLGGPVQRLRGLLSIVVLVITVVAVFSALFAFQRVQQELGSPQVPSSGPNLSGPGPFMPTSPTFPSFATPTSAPPIGVP